MGWQSECGTHEGYLVGLVFDDAGHFNGPAGYDPERHGCRSGRMRELGTRADGEGVVQAQAYAHVKTCVLSRENDKLVVTFGRMACSCGWRSPLLQLPSGSSWVASALLVPEYFDNQCAELWRRHVHASPPVRDGGCNVLELLAHGGRS